MKENVNNSKKDNMTKAAKTAEKLEQPERILKVKRLETSVELVRFVNEVGLSKSDILYICDKPSPFTIFYYRLEYGQ